MVGYTIKKVFFSLRPELLLISASIIVLLIFIPIFTYLYFANDLKSTNSIMNRSNTGVILYDRYGQEYFKFYEAKYREYVPLSDVPEYVRQAVVVSEDKEFYSHPGFSLKSIAAALVANIRSRNLAFGGSTITQQLVKNSLLSPRKNFLRKYQEVVLALEIERRYSKDEILEMYLNSVYFGEGAFGVEAASRTYFGKPAHMLTLSEASLLAGLLTSPSKLSPLTGDRNLAEERQRYVLSEMLQEGYITRELKKATEDEKLVFTSVASGFSYDAPHFALAVKKALEEKYGEEEIARSGFKIYTTIDLSWQKYAEESVKEHVKELESSNVTNGAAVVIEPGSGEVLVMVGSHDWNDPENGKVNMVTTSRQSGSAFKPIIYAEAFSKGLITPASILEDKKRTFPVNYKPKNYDDKFRGPVLVRRALSNSLNIPAVAVMEKVGVADGLIAAKRFGITTLKDPVQYGLSLVLGTGEVPLLELTNVYAMFADNGVINQPTLIQTIEDKNGVVIYQHTPEKKRVLDPESAYQISSILSDNKARREVFGNVLVIDRLAAVKTGTTEDYRDSLTVGYTPQLAVGVWVGNNDNKEMSKVAGSIGAAPIWRTLMTKFLEKKPVMTFKKPESLIGVSVCQNGGVAKVATSSAVTEYFIPGTEPNKSCGRAQPRARTIKSAEQDNPSEVLPSDIPAPPEGIGGFEAITDATAVEKDE